MSPHNSTLDTFLNKITQVTKDKLESERFGVSELAREMGMSRSNLHRKVNSATGKSVSQFIRQIRLEKAMELLKDDSLTVSEVAYRVGFGSATYFSKCFHDHFSFPPGEVAEKEDIEYSSPELLTATSVTRRSKNRIHFPWIITTLIVVIASTVLIITIKPFSGKNLPAGKTIAVLPFRNDSPDKENDYIVNGLMEEILNKLSSMKDLEVVSRTTSEIYRDSEKSLKEIGKELQADYILEGSATILNELTRIRIQLIEPDRDRHLWAKPYEREITLENIFDVQEEIALAVSDELQLVLEPEEKELIERKPTENVAAYDAYMQAWELLHINSMRGKTGDFHRILQAKQLLEQAIALDSSFADAYTALGHIYISYLYFLNNRQDLEKSYAFLDSGHYFVEKALTLYEEDKYARTANSNNWLAMHLKSVYYRNYGMNKEAEQLLQEATINSPKDYNRFLSIASWHLESNNYFPSIEKYLKFLELKPQEFRPTIWIHSLMYKAFGGSGFPELARKYAEHMLTLEEDSIMYYIRMSDLEQWQGNYERAVHYGIKLCELDTSNNWHAARLGKYYIYMDKFEKGARWVRPYMDELEQQERVDNISCLVGYVYQQLGEKELEEVHLRRDIAKLEIILDYPTTEVQCGYVHLHIARVYSMLGDVDKTLEYLAYLKEISNVDIQFISELKNWPSYDLVSETPEFKEILEHMETIFQKEHDRIEKLLIQKGLIAR